MLKKYLPTVVVYMTELFFSISTIVGYQYQGSENSPTYMIYTSIVFIIAMLLFIIGLKECNYKFSKNQLYILSVPFIITFLYLIERLFGFANEMGTTRYIYFLLWPFTGILMGIYIGEYIRFKSFVKSLEVIMLIFTISAAIIIYSVLFNGVRASLGGATYQYAGYVIAFAYGINIYFIFRGRNIKRFRFTNIALYKILSRGLLIVQIIGVIATGARGPMILLIIYTFYLLITSIKKYNNLLKLIVFILITLFILALFWKKLMTFPLFANSWNRVFAYLSPEGLNWDGTSGRGKIYKEAITRIKMSPLYGYGIFGMFTVLGYYPHNIMLEILLQGGVIYFTMFAIIFIRLLKELRKKIEKNKEFNITIILLLYPLVILMFSGTYLNNASIWFVFSLIKSYEVKN